MSTIDYEAGLYDKIGGWLILPAFVHPVVAAIVNLKDAVDNFSAYSDKLSSDAQIFIISCALIAVAFTAAWALSMYLAATLNPIFPKFYIGLLILTVASGITVLAIVADHFKIQTTSDDMKDLTKNVMAAVIWVPYMLVSKRVKATFYGVPMPAGPIHTSVSSPLRPSSAYLEEKSARKLDISKLTMLQRFAMVVYWGCSALAVISVLIGLAASMGSRNEPTPFILGLLGAGLIWIFGRAVKFIVIGR